MRETHMVRKIMVFTCWIEFKDYASTIELFIGELSYQIVLHTQHTILKLLNI